MSTHWVDRSRIETGYACPRKRFFGYHWGGRGLQPLEPSFDLLFGTAVHSFVEAVSQGKPAETGLDAKTFAAFVEMRTPDGLSVLDEANSLYEGLTTTFSKFTLPKILDEFDWIASEVEITTPLTPDISLMSRLDGILRRKADGLYFVLEIKTSSWLEELRKQSLINFQLLLEQHALSQFLRDPFWHGSDAANPPEIGGAVLLVFNKGSKYRATKAEQAKGIDGYRRLSLFTYCYRRLLANGGEEFSLEYKKGFERVPTSTVVDWLSMLEETWPDEMKSQVQLWNSVSFDEVQVERVLRQVIATEQRYQDADDRQLNPDVVWPMNFSNCLNDGGFRRECPFKAACFSPAVGQDPLGSGLYKVREFNHPQEIEQ